MEPAQREMFAKRISTASNERFHLHELKAFLVANDATANDSRIREIEERIVQIDAELKRLSAELEQAG